MSQCEGHSRNKPCKFDAGFIVSPYTDIPKIAAYVPQIKCCARHLVTFTDIMSKLGGKSTVLVTVIE